jgi:PPE-repeat protein
MTAPIWMASPPEVHSALLSSGPGAGSLLAAADAWNSLSAAYGSAAEDLSATLVAMQVGAWQGPSADRCVAAWAPYVAWLVQASADSAAAAAQQQTAAAAYTAALAAMPTLAELAANRAAHAALVATNFFGINSIPIAFNEADYAWMWIQAAVAMTSYHETAGAAVASTPRTEAAPAVVKSNAVSASSQNSGAGVLGEFITDIYRALTGTTPPPATLPDTGLAGELSNDFYQTYLGVFVYFPQELVGAHNPSQLTSVLLVFAAQFMFYRAMEAAQLLNQFGPYLLSTALGLAITNLGAAITTLGGASAFAGLAGLAVLPTPAPAPVAVAVPALPVAAPAPPFASPATVAAPAPAPAHAAAPGFASGSATPPPGPVAGGAGFLPPYAVGPPGLGLGSGIAAHGPARDPATESGTAAAGARSSARDQARARRRRRAKLRDHGDEFMDMTIEVSPGWAVPPGEEPVVASDQGAAAFGFPGTVGASTAAAGLTRVVDEPFQTHPTVPLLPVSWHRDRDDGSGLAD